MSLFTDELASGLLDIRQEYASEITFSRGTEDLDLVDVAEGKTNFRYVNSYGLSVRQETKDFLILASDLGYI